MASSQEQFEQQHNVKTFPRGSKGEEKYTDIQMEQIAPALKVLHDENQPYGYIRRMKMMSAETTHVALETFAIQCPVKPEIEKPEAMVKALEKAFDGKIAVSYDAAKRTITFDSNVKGKHMHPDEATKAISDATNAINDIVSFRTSKKFVPETPDDISESLGIAKLVAISCSANGIAGSAEFASRLGETQRIFDQIDIEGFDAKKMKSLEESFKKMENAEPEEINDRSVNIALGAVHKYIRDNRTRVVNPRVGTIPDNPDADREIWDQNPSALCAFSASLDRYKKATENSGMEIPDIANLQSIVDGLAEADHSIRTGKNANSFVTQHSVDFAENLDVLRKPENAEKFQSILRDMEARHYINSKQVDTVYKQTISNKDATMLLLEAKEAGDKYRASHEVDIKEELGNLPVPPKMPQAGNKPKGRS